MSKETGRLQLFIDSLKQWNIREDSQFDGREKLITPEQSRDVAEAIVSLLDRSNQKYFMISGDARVSTPFILKEMIGEMTSRGINILNVGYGNTTPLFETQRESIGVSGLNITASHQTWEHNGFKLFLTANPNPLNIQSLIRTPGCFTNEGAPGKIHHVQQVLRQNYIDGLDKILGKVDFEGKILFDAMQGTSAWFFSEIARRKGLSFDLIRAESDGYFSLTKKGPDPSSENFDLVAKIKNSHLGDYNFIAMADGDGDRFGLAFTTEFVENPHVEALRAEFSGRDKFVAEYCLASIIEGYLAEKGIQVIGVKRGRKSHRAACKRYEACGSEMGPHNYNAEGVDDAVRNTFEIIGIAKQLEARGETLHEKLRNIAKSTRKFIPELRANVSAPAKEIVERFAKSYSMGSYIDGFSLEKNHMALYLRGSSNENQVTLNFNYRREVLPGEVEIVLAKVFKRLDSIEEGLGARLKEDYRGPA